MEANSPTDKELVQAFRNGDRKSRDILVKRYHNFVVYICVGMVKKMPKHVEVDDLLSYALEGVMKTIDQWNPEGISFMSYLKQVVVWTINSGLSQEHGIKTMSRDARRVRLFSQLKTLDDNGAPVPFESTVADVHADDLAKDIYAQQVWEFAMKELSPFDQQLICGHFMYGLPFNKMAVRLGISHQAVSKYIKGVVSELQQRLETKCAKQKRSNPAKNICFAEGCGSEHYNNGLCYTHSQQFTQHGLLSVFPNIK